MKHYGDITKINGQAVEPVNVIIGGSPCQDLSVAGGQKGIKHAGKGDGETTRSGLFMEQLRIIKEMRCKDIERGRTGFYIRPRFMVWENVPGAFSSPKGNKGADFQAVLEETIKVVNGKAPAVPVPKNGWPSAGCLTDMGGRWSVAWRVFDAQFWGVPQRRKRIALVADFGGLAAPEILFERKGVFGDIEPGRPQGEGVAYETEGSVGAAVRAFCIQGNCVDRADTAGCNGCGWAEGISYTLNTVDRPAVAVFNPGELSRDIGSKQYWENGICPTLRVMGDDNRPAVMLENHPHDSRIKLSEDNVVQSLNARMGTGGNNTPLVMTAEPDVATFMGGCSAMKETIAFDCRNHTANYEVSATLQAKTNGGQSLNYINPVAVQLLQDPVNSEEVAPCVSAGSPRGQAAVGVCTDYTVRRLTPLECERLQGFPDNWTDIGAWVDESGKPRKESNDSARYKALGNSIALPPWVYVLQRLSLCCGGDVTMASLFDGIGGFPLIWERLHGEGFCLWASEIEDFPIAVTKRRFNEVQDEE